MKKIKALFLVAVMLFGICGLSMQAKAACGSWVVVCGNGNYAWGDVCGASHADNMAAVEAFASDLCG